MRLLLTTGVIAQAGAAMKRNLTRSVDWLDDRLAAATLGRRRERPALLGFMFHSVFESAAEVARDRVWPAQPLLINELARFLEHFLAHGYRFLRPADLLDELDPDGYYALLTFDDGYANNQRALPILRALSVPATFFISAGHVAAGRAFWWDVVYRERRRRGVPMEAIRREIAALKPCAPAAIEATVRNTFGADALRPMSDTDRPLTPDELRAFARDPHVILGNHTMWHTDLGRIDPARATAEIRDCQAYLTDLTGSAPVIFAYPNGHCDAQSRAAVAAAGLRLAVTGHPGKTSLPLTDGAALTIARTFVPCGEALMPACARMRSDAQLRRWLTVRWPVPRRHG